MLFFNQISTLLLLLSSLFFIGCQAASTLVEIKYKNYVTNILFISFIMQFFSSLLIADFWKINNAMRYLSTQMYGIYGGHFLM
jgi:hypothetical protein